MQLWLEYSIICDLCLSFSKGDYKIVSQANIYARSYQALMQMKEFVYQSIRQNTCQDRYEFNSTYLGFCICYSHCEKNSLQTLTYFIFSSPINQQKLAFWFCKHVIQKIKASLSTIVLKEKLLSTQLMALENTIQRISLPLAYPFSFFTLKQSYLIAFVMQLKSISEDEGLRHYWMCHATRALGRRSPRILFHFILF